MQMLCDIKLVRIDYLGLAVQRPRLVWEKSGVQSKFG